MTFIKNFLKDEDGASAVEYAILVAIVAGVLAVSANFLNFDAIFDASTNKVTTKINE